MRYIWCPRRDYKIPVSACLRCNKRCKSFTPEMEEALFRSGAAVIDNIKFVLRRTKMYILLKSDGTYSPAPEGFDIENPTEDSIRDIQTVYVVNKALEKKVSFIAAGEKKSRKPRKTA